MAQDEIRRAWIGLEIPLAQKSDEPVNAIGFGALSGPRFMFIAYVLGLLGFGKAERGFLVDACAAFNLLKEHSPSAAEWWETNAPHLFKRGQSLLFHEHACEVIK